MIAHSFRGEVFGPAQKLHGATYAVELEIQAPALDAHGLVADIGRLEAMLKTIIDGLNYRNLDDEPAFAGVNTTTEFLAGELWQRARQAISAGALEPFGSGLEGPEGGGRQRLAVKDEGLQLGIPADRLRRSGRADLSSRRLGRRRGRRLWLVTGSQGEGRPRRQNRKGTKNAAVKPESHVGRLQSRPPRPEGSRAR
jgi:hypothetical protein